ncbi:MAG: hypothetical protein ISS82_01780 [Nanoarchaeota archaeon]|nr:hypothetical protein [Nanoarchaeota archaeon]
MAKLRKEAKKKKDIVTFNIDGKKVKQIIRYDEEGKEIDTMYKTFDIKELSRDFHFVKKSPKESHIDINIGGNKVGRVDTPNIKPAGVAICLKGKEKSL